jgi:tRNA(Ile)-lysidine synthase TilS/MesJ
VKEQNWIFSARLWLNPEARDIRRVAIVGPARASTVEAALHLAGASEELRTEIRAAETVRKFIEGKLDPESNGYHAPNPFPTSKSWVVCIASIHEVIR